VVSAPKGERELTQKGPKFEYEGNLGADGDQENPTKPAKIQQICEFGLDRFGWFPSEFRHRKGIAVDFPRSDPRVFGTF